MTKEEAIVMQKAMRDNLHETGKDYPYRDDMIPLMKESCDIAINALEQEACTDVISRQAAIDCLNADFTIDGKENMETVVDYINGAFEQIKALPSITPQPFINKPCVSEGVCREDKIQVLDKIRAEIQEKGFNSPLMNPVFTMTEIIDIIDKYRESEVEE